MLFVKFRYLEEFVPPVLLRVKLTQNIFAA